MNWDLKCRLYTRHHSSVSPCIYSLPHCDSQSSIVFDFSHYLQSFISPFSLSSHPLHLHLCKNPKQQCSLVSAFAEGSNFRLSLCNGYLCNIFLLLVSYDVPHNQISAFFSFLEVGVDSHNPPSQYSAGC